MALHFFSLVIKDAFTCLFELLDYYCQQALFFESTCISLNDALTHYNQIDRIVRKNIHLSE